MPIQPVNSFNNNSNGYGNGNSYNQRNKYASSLDRIECRMSNFERKQNEMLSNQISMENKLNYLIKFVSDKKTDKPRGSGDFDSQSGNFFIKPKIDVKV